MAEFLFEIGMEEVPARMIAGAEAELARRTVALLGREGLLDEGVMLESEKVKSYSTPRRLALWVRGVKARQADVTEETTGPAVKIAFKDGKPTAAAEAFAKKSGVNVAELKAIATPKGEYLAASVVKKGRSAREVIASELPKEVAAIYFPKNMYWRAGKPERFVRPVLWMVCLLDEAVVPVEFAGKTAGRETFGHRVLFGEEAIEVRSPATYAEQLKKAFVIADVEDRRQWIRKELDRVTRGVADARWREDEALVDTVTHLTEWPAVLLGGFGAEFLELPEEVLVTVMRDHQKYFAVEDVDAKLAPHFLAVLNVALTAENEPVIQQGNERVLRARFNDARFFWEFDQRVPLKDRMRWLEKVTFQKDLGSYAGKTERVHALAKRLTQLVASRGTTVDAEAVEGAALLAKTDLTTELVKEFTELQGVIGGLYARKQGMKAAVCDAIYDQYLPASATDDLPRSPEGALLGLADRVDTLTGMFALGMEPTGSKDPFALRRAANAVVRLLAETDLPLGLNEVLEAAGVPSSSQELTARLRVFFAERVEFYLREVRGQAYDVAKAVMVVGYDDLRDVVARAEAVSAIRTGAEAATFLAVAAAFKRMGNILEQAESKGLLEDLSVEDTGSEERAQAELRAAAEDLGGRVKAFAERRDYLAALKAIATLAPQIDAFFDEVMVMDPDTAVRNRRLLLLMSLLKNVSGIADFSEIVVAG